MRRRRAILIAEDPDKAEKHRESRITLPIRRKKSAMNRKHKIKCVAAQKNTTKKCNECDFGGQGGRSRPPAAPRYWRRRAGGGVERGSAGSR